MSGRRVKATRPVSIQARREMAQFARMAKEMALEVAAARRRERSKRRHQIFAVVVLVLTVAGLIGAVLR